MKARVRAATGVEGRNDETGAFHNLRHTYALWLVIAGVDLYRVKELLGHKSIESTMRYSHLALPNIKGDVERVFGQAWGI